MGKNLLILIEVIVLLSLSSCTHDGRDKNAIVIPGSDLEYYGRVSPQGWMAYPGTRMKLEWNGACDLSIAFYDSLPKAEELGDCVYVVIDQQETRKWQFMPGGNLYEKSFGEGPHTFEVIKLTESQVGMLRVDSVVISNVGGQVAIGKPSYSYERTIEFIGNSITCGYGNEITTNTAGFHAINENVMKTYGARVAEHYKAGAYFTAYSGRGLVRNYDGSEIGLLPDFYDRWIADDSTTRIAEGGYLPVDLLVVNIGTNDMNSEVTTGKPLDSLLFVNKYVDFLSHLREIHPSTPMICAVGPMLNDDYPAGARFLSRCRNYVRQAINLTRQKGDTLVYYHEYLSQTEPFGEDYHPSAGTHAQMAESLIQCIDSLRIFQ